MDLIKPCICKLASHKAISFIFSLYCPEVELLARSYVSWQMQVLCIITSYLGLPEKVHSRSTSPGAKMFKQISWRLRHPISIFNVPIFRPSLNMQVLSSLSPLHQPRYNDNRNIRPSLVLCSILKWCTVDFLWQSKAEVIFSIQIWSLLHQTILDIIFFKPF